MRQDAVQVTVVVPDVGTVNLFEPQADNFHQYIPTTWAIKVIANNYVRYWGYEGGPTVTVTINDDRTFSMPESCNISFDRVPIAGHPLGQYCGIYQTNTQFYGDGFSPLFVNDDGTISFGHEWNVFTPIYNSTTATVAFEWIQYRDTRFKAWFSFKGVGDNLTISGTLNPDPTAGGVSFSGSRKTLVPSLSNIRFFDTFLKDGDLTRFRSLSFAANSSSASVFHLYICMDGNIMIGTGNPNSPALNRFMKRDTSSGIISLASTDSLTSDFEFEMSLPHVAASPAPHAARDTAEDGIPSSLKDGPIGHCDLVTMQLVSHCTLGFIPPLGVGEFMLEKQLWSLMADTLRVHLPDFTAVLQHFTKDLLAIPTQPHPDGQLDPQGEFLLTRMAISFGSTFYIWSPDLIHKWLRIAYEHFGWTDYLTVAASLVKLFTLTNPFEWAKANTTKKNMAYWLQ
ncbi:hypothetical protein H2201_008825 [Coniosporium apollinis]|uniref:Uncharacterized protein n=2 Tax=Coniosporium TaxID=2810619 RepID=A0ABQ9NLS9_9PEZI|nr:hypothetical protein H2199_009231 [Cladosporium sp. JES 115]KAJ9655343.1 hypothetical protein H2201_008825 [Coniosporium apollinis]